MPCEAPAFFFPVKIVSGVDDYLRSEDIYISAILT